LQREGERHPVLSHRTLVWLGRLSYGLYVFHMLGLRVGRKAVEALMPATSMGAVTLTTLLGLLCTLGLAMLSHRFLELPFLELKRHFARVSSAPEATTTANHEGADPIFAERETNRA
jgi:peptidoglycan/LPS O-acetylase OafA/YrhL